MADVIEGVRTHLLADAAIAALVGTRVRPDGFAQGETLPAVAMWSVSGESEEHLAGGAGLGHMRLQVDCMAGTRLAANSLAELVRTRLQGARGLMGALWVDGCTVDGGPRYDRDQPLDGSDEWRYITSRDYGIAHQEDT